MECTLYIDKPAYALKIIIIKFHIKKTKIGVFHTFIIGHNRTYAASLRRKKPRAVQHQSLLRMVSLIALGQKTIRSYNLTELF